MIAFLIKNGHRKVPMADRFMKIYINHPQTICIHPVKWRLDIPSGLGGVRRQRILLLSTPPGPPVSKNKLTKVCADLVTFGKSWCLK